MRELPNDLGSTNLLSQNILDHITSHAGCSNNIVEGVFVVEAQIFLTGEHSV